MGCVRSMNHAKEEPDANVRLDFCGTCVPHWYFPAGDVEYDVWYTCSVVARREIRRGEELRFEYAWTPEDW